MRLTLALALLPTTLPAAERRESITDFDRIRVEGSFDVTVTAGRGTSLVISGTTAAIDATTAAVTGSTLVIRRRTSGRASDRDAGAATIRVTTPALYDAALLGSGQLRIDRMRGQRASVALSGSGNVEVASIVADRGDITLQGSGRLIAAGTIANLRAVNQGSGLLDTREVATADLIAVANTSGTAALAARRSARVTANGSGSVTVAGTPACTVTNTGSGSVSCGAKARR